MLCVYVFVMGAEYCAVCDGGEGGELVMKSHFTSSPQLSVVSNTGFVMCRHDDSKWT